MFFHGGGPGKNKTQDNVDANCSLGIAWSDPMLVSELETEDNWYPNMNADLRYGIGILYLKGSGRTRPGDPPPLDIMFAAKKCVRTADLNTDGIVNFKDFAKVAEYWLQDEWSVDIAPPCDGDHVGDFRNVDIVAEDWLILRGILAYWNLDEIQGIIAHDSTGSNNGIVYGEPLWRPSNGKIGGALEFDGIDDYVDAPFVVNPAESEFSVFAWIKGGAPGQVVVSQTGGANWLAADPSEGSLITDLKSGGRFGCSLWSDAVNTGGDWHRVGLTRDGSNRILYVDDVEVAKDTQAALAGPDGGLSMGAGKDREPGSFFCGLVDDVRIQNWAVTP